MPHLLFVLSSMFVCMFVCAHSNAEEQGMMVSQPEVLRGKKILDGQQSAKAQLLLPPNEQAKKLKQTYFEETALPYQACEGRKFKVFHGVSTIHVYGDSDDPNQNIYARVGGLQSGERPSSPGCDTKKEWIPKSDLGTGMFWEDFYKHVQDYEDAKNLALSAGQERIAFIEQHKTDIHRLQSCLSQIQDWPKRFESYKVPIEPEPESFAAYTTCKEMLNYMVTEYMSNLCEFRFNLALAQDPERDMPFSKENLLNHANLTLKTPNFWPSSSMKPLSGRVKVCPKESPQCRCGDQGVKCGEREIVKELILGEWFDSKIQEFSTKYPDRVKKSSMIGPIEKSLGFQNFIRKEYQLFVNEAKLKAAEIAGKFPSFLSVPSSRPSVEDMKTMLLEKIKNLDKTSEVTKKNMKTIEESRSTEKMDEVFALTGDPHFTNLALKKHPELCASAAGVALRMAGSAQRVAYYNYGMLAGMLALPKVIPAGWMTKVSAGLLGFDGYTLYSLMDEKKRIDNEYHNTLESSQITPALKQVVAANQSMAISNAFIIGFGGVAVRGLRTPAATGAEAAVAAGRTSPIVTSKPMPSGLGDSVKKAIKRITSSD